MKKITKLAALVLLLCLMLTTLVPAADAASTVKLTIGDSITALSPIPFQYTDVYGHSYNLTFTSKPTYFLGSKVAYCIQPSTAVMNGMKYSQNTEETAWTKLSTAQKEAIGLILAYGYPSRSYAQSVDPMADAQTTAPGSLNGSWRNTEGQLATQLLVWEIVMGYRSASSPYSCSTPLASYFDTGWTTLHATYNGIVACLKNHRVIPSYAARVPASAPTHELTYDSASGMYQATLTDTNKVSHLFPFTSSVPGMTLDGSSRDKLQISVPAQEISSLENATTFSCFNNSATLDPDKVAVFSDAETPGGAYQALIQAGDIGVDPIPAYFKLKARSLNLSVKLVKTSDDGNISGIQFNLYTVDPAASDAAPYQTVTTGADGTVQVNDLQPGDYWIEEIAGEEYHPQEVQKVTLTEQNTDSAPATVTFNNIRRTFKIQVIKKKSNTTTPVAGAVYEVKHGSTVVATLTTGADGTAITESFPFCPSSCTDPWTVQEIAAPAGWLLDPTVYTINTNTSELSPILSLTVYDVPIKGAVMTTKVDADYPDNKLSGAVFELYADVNGNKQFDSDIDITIGELPESSTGVYTYADLLYGGYFLHEKEAPKGFLPDDGYYYFEIQEHGKTVIVENNAGVGFINQPIKGAVQVLKTDADTAAPISGAVFELYSDANKNGSYDADTDTLIGTLQDNGDGTYTSGTLRFGRYLIHEAAAPAGYLADTAYYPFAIEQNGKLLTLSNTDTDNFLEQPITGSVALEKKDADTLLPLSGAVFELYADVNGNGSYDADTDTLIGTLQDNGDGTYTSGTLRFGRYLIHEAAAPAGYVADTAYYSLAIEQHGNTVTISNSSTEEGFLNQQIKGKLEITKADATTAELLPGATFEITDQDGNLVATGTTDATGIAVFDELPAGTYHYAEVLAPEGYILDQNSYPFEITENNQVVAVKLLNTAIVTTGDDSNIYLYIVISAVTAMGIAIIAILQRRRRTSRK